MEAAYGFFIVVAMLMTTVLLFGYLRFVRRWHMALVLLVIGVFFTLELANFVANAVKILHRPWLVVAVLLVFGVMFTWYRARKIINRFIKFVPLMDHAQALREQWVKPWDLQPLYLRKPDAEINWQTRDSAP